MLKKLSPRHLEAARLVWMGKTYPEVAAELGVTLNAVKSWGYSDVFKAEVNRLQAEQNDRNKSELDEAAKFQRSVREKTRELYVLCHEKIRDAIEAMDPEQPIHRGFPPLVKALRDLTELTLHVDDATLGLEQLAEEIDAIKPN